MNPMVERWTGVEVRWLRDALRMSVREFASHCGLSVSSIAAIESRGPARNFGRPPNGFLIRFWLGLRGLLGSGSSGG